MIIVVGLLLLLAPVILPAPDTMPETAWLASGLALTMALFWLTEALPLPVTALLPLAAAPLLGIAPIDVVAPAYSHPLVVLFLGGFMLAKAIETSGLHRRLAYSLLGISGNSPSSTLAAVMLATAFLSLWISNTASAMVMAPIAASVAAGQENDRSFGTCLMLGVAFAATIGGMGSLIGTPPNAIFAAYVQETYGIEIGFAQWAAVGLPIALVLLLITWFILAHLTPGLRSAGAPPIIEDHLPALQTPERRVAIVVGATALAWVSRPLIEALFHVPLLTDPGIAITGALMLFLFRDGKGRPLLTWDAAATLRWGVLILFGGGLALASILDRSGLATWIGGSLVAFQHLPSYLLVLLIAALIVYIGELASNTAMAAIFLPIAGASAIALDADPVQFMLPVAFASSIGFMLPVATPPNAIVFGDSLVTRKDMLRAGAPLDVVGIFIAVGLSAMLGPLFF